MQQLAPLKGYTTIPKVKLSPAGMTRPTIRRKGEREPGTGRTAELKGAARPVHMQEKIPHLAQTNRYKFSHALIRNTEAIQQSQ